MADNITTTTLTVHEVRALVDRLQARATSALLRDTPSQQSDSLLAAHALLHLLMELQTLRDEVHRVAQGMSDQTAAQKLWDALAGPHHASLVAVRFDKP